MGNKREEASPGNVFPPSRRKTGFQCLHSRSMSILSKVLVKSGLLKFIQTWKMLPGKPDMMRLKPA